jgi:cytochrome d ubiquinol oxidase subunit I
MRTVDAVTPHGAPEVALTLALFVVVYFLVFGAGIGYILQLIRKTPESASEPPTASAHGAERRPARPMSAAEDDTGANTAPLPVKE